VVSLCSCRWGHAFYRGLHEFYLGSLVQVRRYRLDFLFVMYSHSLWMWLFHGSFTYGRAYMDCIVESMIVGSCRFCRNVFQSGMPLALFFIRCDPCFMSHLFTRRLCMRLVVVGYVGLQQLIVLEPVLWIYNLFFHFHEFSGNCPHTVTAKFDCVSAAGSPDIHDIGYIMYVYRKYGRFHRSPSKILYIE